MVQNQVTADVAWICWLDKERIWSSISIFGEILVFSWILIMSIPVILLSVIVLVTGEIHSPFNLYQDCQEFKTMSSTSSREESCQMQRLLLPPDSNLILVFIDTTVISLLLLKILTVLFYGLWLSKPLKQEIPKWFMMSKSSLEESVCSLSMRLPYPSRFEWFTVKNKLTLLWEPSSFLTKERLTMLSIFVTTQGFLMINT